MKQLYWEEFVKTGKVEDYLVYKGVETCQNIMEKYEEKGIESADNSDRNDTVSDSGGRL